MEEGIAILKKRFDELIGCHRLLIRKICWKYSDNDAAKCGELVQECYLHLWHCIADMPPDIGGKQGRTWVAWRCRRALSHHFRRRKRWWLPLDKVPEDKEAIDDGNALREQVDELTDGLTLRERHYLQLYLDGYSHEEISEKLSIEIDSVYKMRHRIIEKMNRNAES
jgi:RNA polymerase sigma factor (sigma-70 family)